MDNNDKKPSRMKPINDTMYNYGKKGENNTSKGFTLNMDKKTLYLIIFVVIIVMYFMNSQEENPINTNYNSNNEIQSYEQEANTNYVANNYYEGYDFNPSSYTTGSSSTDLLSLLLGGSNNSNGSNTDYSSYDDGSIKNASNEKYTLMVYMCGSNLESDGGYASADIEEMLKAQLADEVNLLIYTGGAKKWYDFGISNKTNQIYKISNHKIELVKDNIGSKSMAESATLLEFLEFCKNNYKADKYALIMWDHGGGAVSGFGLDELNGKKNDTLTIDEIKQATEKFGEKLELIGFDACLMANVETAYALKNSAKYLVASEETEPGTGWDYIKLLNGLSSNTAQDGTATGKVIVDSFIASNSSYKNPDATLSVVDLSKIDSVYASLKTFMKDVKETDFDRNNYNRFAKAIYNSKAFGDGAIDTIDLIDFATKVNNASSNDLINKTKSAIVYNKTNQYVQNSNGLSIFIPNKKLSYYAPMQKIYQNIGMTGDYTKALTQFVNAKAGGRKEEYEVNNYTYTQSSTDYSIYDWFDSILINSMRSNYEEASIDASKLQVQDEGEYFTLKLSPEEWEKIVKVESVVWYDTGNGYLDMGADSYFTMDENNDLKIEFDGTWLAISGDNVKYEVIERTDDYEKGAVPAVINGERVNLILYFDKENPDGMILGYQPDYGEQEFVIFEKGLRKLKTGDKIDFVANMYTYDGEVEDEYYINDTLVVGTEPFKISYESLGDGECLVYYKLTDIYDNVYYTEPVIFE